MAAILIGIVVAAAVGLCWFGYKAIRRIQLWGQRMNDCDRIFQIAGGAVDECAWSAADTPKLGPFAGGTLRPGEAASK